MHNPYMLDTPAVVSFSGGRTSGYMLWHILQAFGGSLPEDVKVVFCNTGKERPETLDFVERCSQRWGVPITWLEYHYESPIPVPTRDADWGCLDDEPYGQRTQRWDQWYELMRLIRAAHLQAYKTEMARRKTLAKKDRKGLPRLSQSVGKHRVVVVDYATASRHGEPFEEVIAARNMLPNIVARFCTVECKIRSTARYLSSLGWTEWTNAIGFRADEPQRAAKLNSTNRNDAELPVTPLLKAGITKPDVLRWWSENEFDLGLLDHEGNCDLCFLKGASKRRRIMRDDPQSAAWWIRMEAAADSRGLARNKSVAYFRKDQPSYRIQLEMAQRATLFDGIPPEADELSVACHCTD